jgi:hypothetical protein
MVCSWDLEWAVRNTDRGGKKEIRESLARG